MSSLYNFAIYLHSFLVGIVETKSCGISLEPEIIFVGICKIQSICFASFGDYFDIYRQSCLMFTRADLSTLDQFTSLSDQKLLKSWTSIGTSEKQSITIKIIPKMPSHISKMYCRFGPQTKFLSVVGSKIRIDSNQVLRSIVFVVKRMISM